MKIYKGSGLNYLTFVVKISYLACGDYIFMTSIK
jgi:hypothetical protein